MSKEKQEGIEKLEVKNGIIQLDPNNPFHREWFENDEDYNI